MDCEGQVADLDIVVVGAGISGLTAAHFLLERDPSLRIIVLEASDRVGGRLTGCPVDIANSTEPKKFDLGGEWILPSQSNTIELLDRLNLQTFPNEASPNYKSDHRNLKRLIQVGRKGTIREIDSCSPITLLPSRPSRNTGIRSWLANLELMYITWKLDRIGRNISMVNPYSYDYSKNPYSGLYNSRGLDSMSVEGFLLTNTRFQSVRDVITIQLRFLCGMDPASMSLLFLLAYAQSQSGSFSNFLYGKSPEQESNESMMSSNNNPVKIVNGAWQISERLKKIFEDKNILRMNEPVQGLTQIDINPLNPNKNENSSLQTQASYVTTKTGSTYKCKHIICAVPPNMIPQIEFSPPLPASKQYMINSMNMGSYIKFVLTYDEAYWKGIGYSGDFVSAGGGAQRTFTTIEGDPITVLCDGTTYDGIPALVGFLGGRLAVQWGQKGTEALKSNILENLSRYFGTWVREPAGFFVKDWSEERFLGGGSVCVPAVGSMHAFHTLRQPYGTIHFAGTETAVDYYGTISGAIQVNMIFLADLETNLLVKHFQKNFCNTCCLFLFRRDKEQQ